MLNRSKMLATTLVAAVACCALLARGQNQPPKPAAVPQTKPVPAAPPAGAKSVQEKPSTAGTHTPAEADDDADEKAIRESADAFTRLYNEHDAKGLAALFSPKAEVVDEDGKLVKGRDAIQAEFAQQFQEQPKCSMRVDVESIRVLTPNIALEEGVARCAEGPGESEEVTVYTCVHIKVDGKWLLASVSDFAAPPEALTPHEHLQDLAWMVGDWVDESPDSTVHSTCEWHASGNFLMNHFAVQFAGSVSMHGTTRIGWDAVAKRFRSWMFDSEGGFTEGLWIQQGDEWIVKTNGATADGEVCSSTNVYRTIDRDTFTFRSYDRVVDGELTDDIVEVVIKRRAPAPAE